MRRGKTRTLVVMGSWQPISASELSELISRQLRDCEPHLRRLFETHRVAPYRAPFAKQGTLESVFVIAKKGQEVLYYEDVEDGFNVSPVSDNGAILEHWCNQDDLGIALQKWQ